jgi:hypothetical protein
MHVHAHDIEGGISIAATNVVYDTAEHIVIRLAASDIAGKRFQILESAQWKDIQPQIGIEQDVATLTFHCQVQTLKTAFITIR